MAQYGIEFQKLDLSNINNFSWMCMMQLPILNIGNLATLLIYDKLGMERVYYTTTCCLEHVNQRVKNARRQSTYVKTRRCIVRELKRKRGTKQRTMRVLYMALGNLNVFIILVIYNIAFCVRIFF